MKNYQTFVFDFDSTLIKCEALDTLASMALQGNASREEILEELEAITAQGMRGDIGFDESLSRRLGLFRADKTHIDELIEVLKRSVTESARQRAPWFEANRDRVYVISGGFKDYITPVVELLGIRADHVYANHFTYDSAGGITGFAPDSHLCRAGGKTAQLAELQLPRPLVMIGDGYTDYEVKADGQADQFWALTENVIRQNVVDRADRVLVGFGEMV